MKGFLFIVPALLVCSCSQKQKTEVVSQNYYHKYGFEVAEKEWEERHKSGKVVSHLDNGVTITENYTNGIVDGPTIRTYPHSTLVQKKFVYDQGVLLKEILYDRKGLPIWEKDFEFEGQVVKTTWNQQGIPQSIEEFKEDKLLEAKYYDSKHEKESTITNGFGTKIKRNRKGTLLYKETIEDGIVTKRVTYHPNGKVQSESTYKDLELHGPQTTFSPEGDVLSEATWVEGVLHGDKVLYRNGLKAQETPYVFGKKHGVETFYKNGELTAEIRWRDGIKHGSSRYYTANNSSIEWYFRDKKVTRNQFESLEQKDKIIADFKHMF